VTRMGRRFLISSSPPVWRSGLCLRPIRGKSFAASCAGQNQAVVWAFFSLRNTRRDERRRSKQCLAESLADRALRGTGWVIVACRRRRTTHIQPAVRVAARRPSRGGRAGEGHSFARVTFPLPSRPSGEADQSTEIEKAEAGNPERVFKIHHAGA
jgi:hypothetical protein